MDLKKRLSAVVEQDKKINPKYMAEVLKSDFYYLINNYFEVEMNDITVEIGTQGSKYYIKFSCLGDRMKMVRTLPD